MIRRKRHSDDMSVQIDYMIDWVETVGNRFVVVPSRLRSKLKDDP